jgi:hypothetical protein
VAGRVRAARACDPGRQGRARPAVLQAALGGPTIGTLFALNFIGATAIGLALLTPIEHLAVRYGGLVVTLLALAGVGQSATSFVFLWIAERTPLFGFQEPGYDPAAIAASRISEIAAVVLLGAFLIGRTADHRRSSS